MSQRTLIINADDLGLAPSVNTAIFDVFRAGNLSSATLMVNMPGTADAVARAKDHPGLGIGLHFCLTEGKALVGPSTLTGADGTFMDRTTLVRRVSRGRVAARDIRHEFEAQLARMHELGLRPTHTDSHQHVHMVPRIFQAIAPVLREAGLPVRMVDPPGSALRMALGRPRKAIKQWMNRRFAALDRMRSATRSNDVLVSIHDLDSPGPYDAATYASLVDGTRAGQVVEVMVHPYILGDDVLALYANDLERKRPFLQRCRAEYEALSKAPLFGAARLIDFSAA